MGNQPCCAQENGNEEVAPEVHLHSSTGQESSGEPVVEQKSVQETVEPAVVETAAPVVEESAKNTAVVEQKPAEETAQPIAVETAVIAPSDEHPAAMEFIVKVEKTAGAKVGLIFDTTETQDPYIVTTVHTESLVDAWNKANPDKAVQVDDRLMKVNGDSEKLIQRIKDSDGQVELTFLRPKPLTLSVQKNKEDSDVGVSLFGGTKAIFIMSIKEGSMFDKKASETGVKAFDRIISVNGKREESSAMIQCIQKADSVDLQVLSY